MTFLCCRCHRHESKKGGSRQGFSLLAFGLVFFSFALHGSIGCRCFCIQVGPDALEATSSRVALSPSSGSVDAISAAAAGTARIIVKFKHQSTRYDAIQSTERERENSSYLILFADRPAISVASCDHELPYFWCSVASLRVSSSVHGLSTLSTSPGRR